MLHKIIVGTMLMVAIPSPYAIAQNAQNSDTLTGHLELISSGMGVNNRGECYGQNGFNDIMGQIPVIIKNESGTVIAVGKTETGKQPEEHSAVRCIFNFRVENIPKSLFYSVEIGRRGSETFSRQQLEDQGWDLRLRLHR
ncbi:MAG: hypothetical protein ACK47Y_15160 [Dolichospermum sp.]|jgi:hypothetical protein